MYSFVRSFGNGGIVAELCGHECPQRYNMSLLNVQCRMYGSWALLYCPYIGVSSKYSCFTACSPCI